MPPVPRSPRTSFQHTTKPSLKPIDLLNLGILMWSKTATCLLGNSFSIHSFVESTLRFV